MQNINDNAFEDFHDLLFRVRRSIRYHGYRRKFFDQIGVSVTAASFIFGSATVAAAIGSKWPVVAAYCGAIITALATLSMVFRVNEKARHHFDLGKRFGEIEKTMLRKGEVTASDVREWMAEVLSIEMEEPPIKRVLDTICHNELIRAYDLDPNYYVRVGWFQRFVKQWVDWSPESLHTGYQAHLLHKPTTNPTSE